jgi:hypothetical protein
MAVRDEQRTTNRTGGMPPWKDTVGHLPAILAVGAVVLYAYLSICYDRFYGTLGINPSDVGLSYTGTLTRSASFVVANLIALTLAAAGVVLAVGSRRAQRRLPKHYWIPPVGLMVVLGGVLIVLSFVQPYLAAWSAAEAVKAGEPVSAVPFAQVLPLTTLAIHADPAIVEPAGKPGDAPAAERLQGRKLLYLGQSDGTVVLYDAAAQRTIYLPGSSIILHVANCGAKLPPDSAGVKRPPDAKCEQMRSWWP